jgi:Ca2+-binding EF-hand superfamily protein
MAGRGQDPAVLPQILKKRLQMTKDVVPPGLRSLDYWQIMDYWKMFDKNGDGQLDKNEFYVLMKRMNPDPVERHISDQMFACVDADDSGEIDCEEFLSWIFQMYAPYSGGLRERLGDMNPGQVVEYFKRIDTNGNGELDKSEFWTFLAKFCPEARLSPKEASDLFEVIDKDSSGEVDAYEFVRWVYPGLQSEESARATMKTPIRPQRMPKVELGKEPLRTTSRGGAKDIGPRSASRSKTPILTGTGKLHPDLMRAKAEQPVVLEFTIGPDFRTIMMEIQKAFSKKLAGSISTKIVVDQQCRGCSRFVLRVGRGVVLWDKPSMMAYRDNPFETFDSSRQFVLETIKERMPTLLRASRQYQGHR